MAAPVKKRRKVDHTSSNEAEDASFASLGGSEEEDASTDGSQPTTPDEGLVGHIGDFSESEGRDNGTRDEDSKDGASDHSTYVDGTPHDQIEDHTRPNRRLGSQLEERTRPKRKSDGVPSAINTQRSTLLTGGSRSNLFRLQVDELLEQLRPRHKSRDANIENVLRKLKNSIEKIPSRAPLPVEEAERLLLTSQRVAVPFPTPRPSKDAKYKLEYAPPTKVNVVGSYALMTAGRTRGATEVDLIVTMPSTLFQEKDYTNYRYFYKRAYYIACIAAGIQDDHAKDFGLNFQSFHDNPLQPILVVIPLQGTHETDGKEPQPTWKINILPCVSPEVFSPDKLRLDKVCVRSSTSTGSQPSSTDTERVGTQFYNSTLRSEMLVSSYLSLLHATSKECSAFQDACLLGRTWLRQRGLASNIHAGGFGNFEFSTMIALLLKGGGTANRPVLSDAYSGYQLFRASLQLLATRDLSTQALVIGSAKDPSKSAMNGLPVVWDDERKHNLLFKMSSWSYKLLRHEAGTTLSMSNDQQVDGFEATFILRTDLPLYRFDRIMQLSVLPTSGLWKRQHQAPLPTCQKLYNILKQGLGDRIKLLVITPEKSGAWDLGHSNHEQVSEKRLVLGFLVSPETVHRTIDHGPAAENKAEVAAFREFWGERAELRRFKDGSIHEALVWSAPESGQSVVEQVTRHLIRRHFANSIEEKAGMLKTLLHDTGVSAFRPLMDAYKQLESDIRALEGLPLSIRQINPADAQLRYSSLVLPSPSIPTVPADVTIQFEGSSRWPDDIAAIQRTKVAILLKLSELLQSSSTSLTAVVGIENHTHDILNKSFLDVRYSSDAAYRIRIHHDHEQTLLERKLKDKSLDPMSKEIAALGLAMYKRDLIKAPRHTQAISLLCSHHPAMSGAIRLAKKWFASHLLSNHFVGELIEMLVAHTFVHPWPWRAPASEQTAFLRTLLWMSRWDWRTDPLVVDLSGRGELKQIDIQTIATNSQAWRKLDPSLNRVVILAASNVDTDVITWTDGRPSKAVAGRMTTLARAACVEIEGKRLLLDPTTLFASSLDDFDFIIHLKPELLRNGQRKRNTTTFRNLELGAMDDIETAGFDALDPFIRELETTYASALLLFSGIPVRPIIAGLWSPQNARRAWKPHLTYSTVPLKGNDTDEVYGDINKEAILGEIAKLGGDLIQELEVIRW